MRDKIRHRQHAQGPFHDLLPATLLAWRSASGWATAIVGIAVVSALIPVSTAWLTKLLLDRLSRGSDLATVILLAAALALLGLLTAVCSATRRYCDAELARRTSLFAQDKIYRAVNGISGLSKFEDPKFIDRLRIAAQTGGTTPSQVFQAVLGLATGVLTIGSFLVSLLVINPVMAVAMILGAIPTLAAEIALSRRRALTVWRMSPSERREMAYSLLISSATAAKEVRLFGLGDFFHARMLDERRRIDGEKRRIDLRTLRVQFGPGILSALVSGGGLVWTVVQALNGRMTVGDIAMFVAAVAGAQGGLTVLVSLIASTSQQLALFTHYQEIIAIPVNPATNVRSLPATPGQIELKDVWFRYGPDHPWVLRGIDLTIPLGRSVGLVGANGSGKSTLVKLLCRFYDPTEGSILWNGVDLRDIDPDLLRSRISAVFQDFMRYDLSAAESIGMGDLAKLDDREAIEQSAERAGIHQALSALPQGYDTLVTRFFLATDEAEGVPLSGGQEQRVAIARALLRDDRDLLILDEPSSGLDAEAEHEIHSSLRNYRRGRTSVLISHRLSAVRDADILAVLDDGVIAEQGDHAELMSSGGIYARLFRLQASGYQEAAAR
ncbi:ABC transporter ATP-binding protein [Streptosporangium roseum]|uniref:ABC transporter ATP-binding protein n=1 Tax=Streptosporangium roseum TaxID=2001 RepID=UPI00068DF061|nr:ABC transporter ATP-binding protein [Streptosporangium roseum]